MAGVSVACFAYCLNAFSSVSHDQSNEAASLFGRVKQQFVYFWAFLQQDKAAIMLQLVKMFKRRCCWCIHYGENVRIEKH